MSNKVCGLKQFLEKQAGNTCLESKAAYGSVMKAHLTRELVRKHSSFLPKERHLNWPSEDEQDLCGWLGEGRAFQPEGTNG